MTVWRGAKGWIRCQRLQPRDRWHRVMRSRLRRDETKSKLSLRARRRIGLGGNQPGRQAHAEKDPFAERYRLHQNLYPAPSPMTLLPTGEPVMGELSR